MAVGTGVAVLARTSVGIEVGDGLGTVGRTGSGVEVGIGTSVGLGGAGWVGAPVGVPTTPDVGVPRGTVVLFTVGVPVAIPERAVGDSRGVGVSSGDVPVWVLVCAVGVTVGEAVVETLVSGIGVTGRAGLCIPQALMNKPKNASTKRRWRLKQLPPDAKTLGRV